MPGPSKIATCCYCGTRAALVLRGKDRKELSCASCGAPLHDLKNLPTKGGKPKPTKPAKRPKAAKHDRPKKQKRKPEKRRKGLLAKVFDEAWDVIDDIFD